MVGKLREEFKSMQTRQHDEMPGGGVADHLVEVGVCFHNLQEKGPGSTARSSSQAFPISVRQTAGLGAGHVMPITSLVLTHFSSEKSVKCVSSGLPVSQQGDCWSVWPGTVFCPYILIKLDAFYHI